MKINNDLLNKVTTSQDGIMRKEDKIKLDNIGISSKASGASTTVSFNVKTNGRSSYFYNGVKNGGTAFSGVITIEQGQIAQQLNFAGSITATLNDGVLTVTIGQYSNIIIITNDNTIS